MDGWMEKILPKVVVHISVEALSEALSIDLFRQTSPSRFLLFRISKNSDLMHFDAPLTG